MSSTLRPMLWMEGKGTKLLLAIASLKRYKNVVQQREFTKKLLEA